MLSLGTANLLYVWGARVSLVAAILTAIAAIVSIIGTRVRDRHFDNEIARLNLQASQFEKDAAKALLEQEELKSKLAWRRLTQEQIQTLINVLKGQKFKIVLRALSADPEITLYLSDFKNALEKAGLEVSILTDLVRSQIHFGLYIAAPGDSPEFRLIIKAMSDAGIPFQSGGKIDDLQLIIGHKAPPL